MILPGPLRRRYGTRLDELTPEAMKGKRLSRLGVELPGLCVLILLDMNDRLIARFAKDLPKRWDPNVFPWSAQLEAAWPTMKAEMEAYLRVRTIPDTAAVNGMDPDGPAARASVPVDVGHWRALIMQWFGEDIEEMRDHFPGTMAAFKDLTGITSIAFTGLDGRSHIAEHCGPNRGAVRYQLPIIIPGPPGACRIRVDDEMIPWVEGECVVFDLSVPHEVWNDTDEFRVLLMLEVPMPLPFPLSLANRLAQSSYRLFPNFKGLRDRVRELAADHDLAVAA